MASHLLVAQLRFSRSEFVRALDGVGEDDAARRLGRMNCLSWIVGHLANQEHNYWVIAAQGENLYPRLDDLVGYGRPASTPSLDEMWATWHAITTAADRYLDALTPEALETHLVLHGRPMQENVGTTILRNVYHYWFHLGEAHAIRQMLGHQHLPDFVGDLSPAAYGSR